GRVGAVLALDAADAGQFRLDVIELVNDGVELRNPRVGARVEALLPRTIERLIAEARQRERQHVLHVARADGDRRRLRDEPLRAPRQLVRRAIAPEVIARFAGWKREAVAGGEGAFGVGSSG